MSLGGHVLLLNSNAIHIFILSLLKMVVKVWKKIVKIQRRLMWDCVKGVSKITWVRWSNVVS